MAKSEIIKDFINGNSSIRQTLERLKVILFELENDKLINWINSELNGYDDGNEIPSYRKVVFTPRISGYDSQESFHRAQLSLDKFPEDIKHMISSFYDAKGIDLIEMYASESGLLRVDLPHFLSTFELIGIKAHEFYGEIHPIQYKNIVSNLRSKILDSLLYLEREFGNLDEMDVNTSEKTSEKIMEINNNLIHQINFVDNSVKIGDKNEITDSIIGSNNED